MAVGSTDGWIFSLNMHKVDDSEHRQFASSNEPPAANSTDTHANAKCQCPTTVEQGHIQTASLELRRVYATTTRLVAGAHAGKATVHNNKAMAWTLQDQQKTAATKAGAAGAFVAQATAPSCLQTGGS